MYEVGAPLFHVYPVPEATADGNALCGAPAPTRVILATGRLKTLRQAASCPACLVTLHRLEVRGLA